MLSRTFECPKNGDKNVLALLLAPVVKYLGVCWVSRSRSVLTFASEQSSFVALGSRSPGLLQPQPWTPLHGPESGSAPQSAPSLDRADGACLQGSVPFGLLSPWPHGPVLCKWQVLQSYYLNFSYFRSRAELPQPGDQVKGQRHASRGDRSESAG